MFLSATPAALLAPGLLNAAQEDAKGPKAPTVTRPRATSGDAIEPEWEQRMTVTVGPKQADLVGSDHRVIQAGVDYVSGLGGGTVRILLDRETDKLVIEFVTNADARAKAPPPTETCVF